jgi:hypothetical protein
MKKKVWGGDPVGTIRRIMPFMRKSESNRHSAPQTSATQS